ncbi:hypothetical protein SASPL_113061 [Salvia splendens]|uniref:Uncharacterized protein n=1 Tax=Salvia splendens TaxID=180675 RepID=A0A8X8ZZF8_SALSN|nr:uncharacterized protein LOC121802912 [Salvia splendens]KAG6422683.1 hypothetical protein SASPL_113061 [Salvia splendens]
MEQSAVSCSSLISSPNEDEFAVCQILLGLRKLLSLSESLSDHNWGCRRKRSCLVSPPSASSLPENRIEETCLPLKAEEEAAAAVSSPETPLSFPRSECDDRHKHSSKKRLREGYLDMINRLTERKELLSREIKKVKNFHNELKAYNSQLKSFKQAEMRRDHVLRLGGRDIDLNRPAFGDVEVCQPFDAAADKRARSAEARMKRMKIIKNKSRFRKY